MKFERNQVTNDSFRVSTNANGLVEAILVAILVSVYWTNPHSNFGE